MLPTEYLTDEKGANKRSLLFRYIDIYIHFKLCLNNVHCSLFDAELMYLNPFFSFCIQ